jgi:hypothetical protein
VSIASNGPYAVKVVADYNTAGEDGEIGADSTVDINNPQFEVTVANLALTTNATPSLNFTLPQGVSIASWTCSAFDGAICSQTNGTGAPTLGTLAAQGYVRIRLQLAINGVTRPVAGSVALQMPGDTNALNNVATFLITETPMFSSGFE